MSRYLRLLFLLLIAAVPAVGQSAPASRQPVPVDRIVAVVNDEVITANELRLRLNATLGQLQRQGTALPPRDVLERQMLERMVMDKVQLHYARETGLRVDDAQLEQALQRIAAGNKLTMPQLRAALEKDGIPFASFREEIRAEMAIARIREREVDGKLFISEGEIDNYLSGAASHAGGEEYQLAHILLRAPESATPEQIQKLKAKAEQVRERSNKGEDFAQLAAAY
ncbi:MAG TPA: SurA N-terminal domain-containing protein, partial [Accumulibacter sp.]|nr:SurA N-terminal domain-containing protein [Accumulibacter sp.]